MGLSRRQLLGGTLGTAAGSLIAAACSGGNGLAGDSGVPTDSKAIKGGPKATPNPDVLYPDGYTGPIASHKAPLVTGEQVTLKVVVPQDPAVGDWKRNTFTQWYEKRTGVHIEWQVVANSGDDLMTKVNAMIAAGDVPDVFMSVGFSNAQLQLYGSQGLFLPLGQIVDDYCPETRRIFANDPDVEKLLTATDGEIYSLPNINDCFQCRSGNRMWVYRPWLDKLGLDLPRTLEDFEAMLEAFRTRDPNGNGKADELPLMADTESALDSYVMGAFLYNPGDPWLVLDEHGKVDVTFNKPGWRSGLRYLNSLYRKGLLAKESFTQTPEQLKRIGDQAGDPVLGAVRNFYWGGFVTLDNTKPDARWRDYVTLPPLEGPGGVRTAPWDYYAALASGDFVVTRACRNPAIAAQWADGMYELEAIVRSYAGEKDKEWRWAKRGELGFDGRQGIWKIDGTWPPEDGRWWGQLGVQYRSNDFRLGEVTDQKHPIFAKLLYEDVKRDYYPYREPKERQLPPLFLTEDQAAQTGDLGTTIANEVTGSLTRFALGELDPSNDADWKEYVGTLDRMGLRAYLQLHQAAYDAKY